MEITLKLDGKERVFKQDKINFITVRKALEWQDVYNKSVNILQEYFDSGIDGELDQSIIEDSDFPETIEMLQDIVDLVVSYFDGQFTYDDFVYGYYVNSIQDFYILGFNILNEVNELTDKTNKSTEKKPQPKK